LQKTTALITGASGGIGYEFARLLAKDCGTLVLVARSENKLHEVKRELEALAPATVLVIPCDLSRAGAAAQLYDELEQANITVDILINNAGFAGYGAFVDRDWQKESDMIAVNITALTHLTRLFAKDMVERKSGRIMNVASTAAFLPGPFMAVYYASKAYVLSFSESLANELRGTGVTVTALCPGPTATGWAVTAGVDRSRLFKHSRPASAADVARYGYKAMMKGKVVAVHGMLNKLMIASLRTAPRWLLPVIVRWLHRPAGRNNG
jgi:short-subunit dehydrogenase